MRRWASSSKSDKFRQQLWGREKSRGRAGGGERGRPTLPGVTCPQLGLDFCCCGRGSEAPPPFPRMLLCSAFPGVRWTAELEG